MCEGSADKLQYKMGDEPGVTLGDAMGDKMGDTKGDTTTNCKEEEVGLLRSDRICGVGDIVE